MIIGIPKETKPNEYRVAATPVEVRSLTMAGNIVWVAEGAGVGASFSDAEYRQAGAEIRPQEEIFRGAELIYKVKEYQAQEYKFLQENQIIFAYLHSNAYPEQTLAMLKAKIIGIAYEDVDDEQGQFPLLAPMSELAGMGGFLAASHFSQSVHGGPGLMLASIAGTQAPIIVIFGAGFSGMAAAKMALALGNKVFVFEKNAKRIRHLQKDAPDNLQFLPSDPDEIERILPEADIIINCVLWPKTRKDHLIRRDMLSTLKPSCLIVDVACDENGAVETCRTTTHDDPIYSVDGIRHYCVDNIPSAFARVASQRLGSATLPHVLSIAELGVEEALRKNAHLRRGLSFYKGALTLEETGKKLNLPYCNPLKVL